MLAGIIERGSNGFIAAPPKGAKSFTAADLAISLATGSSWLGFAVPRPVRVGLVSREDNPNLTQWRLKSLMAGKGLNTVQHQMLETNLYINTRAQTPGLMLDNEAEVNELLAAIKARQLEFVLLDVFNVLHAADENDNTEMRKVLNQCKRIQDESGAAIGILHHYSKDLGSSSITQRLRGASAIAGFAEWMIGITMTDEKMRIRLMQFELKAACPPEPINFHIDAAEGKPAKISRVNCEPAATTSSRSQKAVN
jgi:RecA-family ATPase